MPRRSCNDDIKLTPPTCSRADVVSFFDLPYGDYDIRDYYRSPITQFREGVIRLRCILGLRGWDAVWRRTRSQFVQEWDELLDHYSRSTREWLRDPKLHQPMLVKILELLQNHGNDVWPKRDIEAYQQPAWLYNANLVGDDDPPNIRDFYKKNLVYTRGKRNTSWDNRWYVTTISKRVIRY